MCLFFCFVSLSIGMCCVVTQHWCVVTEACNKYNVVKAVTQKLMWIFINLALFKVCFS